MKKSLKIIGIALGIFVLVLTVGILFFLFDKPLVKNILQDKLEKRLGMTVRIGKLDYSFFPFRLVADTLELGQENAFQKMSVSVARLEAGGEFRNLVRGIDPAFETIRADGVIIRIESKGVSKEPLDLEVFLTRTAAALAWAKQISISHARLSAPLGTREAILEDLDITITAGNNGDDVSYSLKHCGLSINDKARPFSLTSSLSSLGTLRLALPFSIDATFSFDSLRVSGTGIEESLASVNVSMAGQVDTNTRKASLSRLKIDVPGLLDLDGTAVGGWPPGAFLETDIRARIDKLENLTALFKPRLPSELRDARLSGRAEIAANYKAGESKDGRRDSLTGSLLFENLEFDHHLEGLPVHILARGRIDASGPLRNPVFKADIRSSVGKISLGNLVVGKSDVHIIAAGNKSGGDISRLDAVLGGLEFNVGDGKKIVFDKGDIAGTARLDLERKTVTFKFPEVSLPGLSPLFLSGNFGLEKNSSARIRIESHGLGIPPLRALAAPFIPKTFSGWNFDGAADFALDALLPAGFGKEWTFSGTMSLAKFKFNDPSFTIAGESLNPVLRVEVTNTSTRNISFTSTLDIGQGESLWKAFYISWNKHPLKMTASGRYNLASGNFEDLTARFVSPMIGEFGVSGSVETRPALSYDLRTDARLSLGPLYSLTTQAGGGNKGSGLNLEGTLGAALLVRKNGGALSIGGRLTIAGTSIEKPLAKTLILGISADIPVRYEASKTVATNSETLFPEEGFLRIGEFQSPFATLKAIDVSLRAGVNAIAFEPFTLEIYGGRIKFGRTIFSFDQRFGSLQGASSLTLRDIDISLIPISSPQFKLTGKMSADFPKLDISPREIAVSGRGEANVFGGKVLLQDISVSRPFSQNRAISLNVDLLDLDLKKLTDEIPFGEVTGIVRGEIRNLVISYGQPERFDFRIESVPRKGVPRTFSLKAVDDLTVLSAGQPASAGTAKFWMRFIRGFHYQKLGIVGTLHNDTFTLNGTIREGGVEYLVKKPALFGINVVNRMPKNVISFKEMVNRLKRVGQSENNNSSKGGS